MDRLKTFGIYALCVILFFIFSNVMINVAIKSMYMPIDVELVERDTIKVDTNEAKATYVNGYVSGNIKNTGEGVVNTYIKIDLYSKRDILLGTRYVEITNMLPNEIKDFRMGFKLTDVDHCKIGMVDELDENVTEEQFTSVELRFAQLLAAVILLCYFG